MGGTTLSEFRLRGIDEERALGRTRGLDLDDLFLFEAKRRVMKDRTVSLHGRLYEVDAILVGHSITLRYDPQAPTSRPPCRSATTAAPRDRPHASTPTPIPSELAKQAELPRQARPLPPGTLSPTTPRPSRDRHRSRCKNSRRRTDVPASLRPDPAALRDPGPYRRAVRLQLPARGRNSPQPPHRTARHRLAHRASSRSERHFQARSAQGRPPCAAMSPPPCIRACTACATSPSPPATCSTCTSPSPGNSAFPPSVRAPPPTAPSEPKSPAWCARPSSSPSSSSTKRTTCATTSSKTSGS